jgi:hypothetical protein
MNKMGNTRPAPDSPRGLPAVDQLAPTPAPHNTAPTTVEKLRGRFAEAPLQQRRVFRNEEEAFGGALMVIFAFVFGMIRDVGPLGLTGIACFGMAGFALKGLQEG